MNRRHLLALSPRLAAGLLAAPTVARAQVAPWPTRQQLRLVVPFPPGGFSDVVARLLTQPLGQALSQTMVVENRPGAGGTVGADNVAKSAADGYSLAVSHVSPHGVAPGIYPQLPYDPVTDFTHLLMVCETPTAIMVRQDSPIRDLQHYLETARRQGLRYGTSGIGSIGHLQGEVLAKAGPGSPSGTRLEHVPYRGTAPAVQDLLAGQIESIFDPVAGLVPQLVAGGTMRMIALSAGARLPALPAVPTFAELGLDSVTATAWMGLSAPRGLPPATGERLAQATLVAMERPELRARMEELAVFAPAAPLTGAAYAGFIQAFVTKWSAVACAANILAG